ncbi:ADP-ribosylation factor family protein [Tritrichomonas foetus]|uniref:ADP-ribosylation factor family protein n=1 Tax=Tritrichomonas foetus TaxID=1144522 RepID=A0A1J4JYK2_9EUKA|nr:ADP-ribosylation factor family protein [Tritrichomonas foetus]|eukprot:OHT03552.1 ADP-ribosylation factor family protein [Tritrichomonas foetus]
MGCCASAKTVAQEEIVISIFGLNNAGKTCLLHALNGSYDFDCVPTIGFAHATMMYDATKLTIYDLGGSAKFRSVWQRYYAFIFGFVYVVDSSDPEKFEESKKTLEGILAHPMMAGKPYVVVANKQDIDGHVSKDEIRKKLEIPEDVEIYDAIVTEVKDGKCNPGVTNSVTKLIQKILNSYDSIQKKRVADIEEQEEIEKAEHAKKLERIRSRQNEESSESSSNSIQPSSDHATSSNGTKINNNSTTLESNIDDETRN